MYILIIGFFILLAFSALEYYKHQKYRKQITGAQASDKELRTIRPLIANLSQNPEAFLGVSEDMLRETNNILSNRIQVMKDAGRDPKVIANFEKTFLGDVPKSYSSVAEVEAANLPVGTEVIINGRRAVIE